MSDGDHCAPQHGDHCAPQQQHGYHPQQPHQSSGDQYTNPQGKVAQDIIRCLAQRLPSGYHPDHKTETPHAEEKKDWLDDEKHRKELEAGDRSHICWVKLTSCHRSLVVWLQGLPPLLVVYLPTRNTRSTKKRYSDRCSSHPFRFAHWLVAIHFRKGRRSGLIATGWRKPKRALPTSINRGAVPQIGS